MTRSVCVSDWSTLSQVSSSLRVKDESSPTSSVKKCFCGDSTRKTSAISASRFSREAVQDAEVTVIYNRIVDVFERAISKFEFAAIIPKLVEDPELRRSLTEEELKIVSEAFLPDVEQTCPCPESDNALETLPTNDANGSELSLEDDSSTSTVFQAFNILYNQAHVREMTKEIEKAAASSSVVLFLHHFRSIVDDVLTAMRLTPEQARAKELYYRKVWRDQKQCKDDVTKLTANLETLRDEHKKAVDVVMARYKKDLVAVEAISRKCVESMRLTTTKSERMQLAAYKESETKQNELRVTLFNATTDLEALQESNSRTEQNMRKKRFKIQSQLQGIINKFDTEIGDRHRQFAEIMEVYEADKLEKHALLAFVRDFENASDGAEKEEDPGTYQDRSSGYE